MRKDENYLLRPVGRLAAGDSGTLVPRPTNCQSAYAFCGGGGGGGEYDSPGEMSGPRNTEAIQKIVP